MRAYNENLEQKAGEGTVETMLTTHHEMISRSQLNEDLGFEEEKFAGGTLLSQNPTCIFSEKNI